MSKLYVFLFTTLLISGSASAQNFVTIDSLMEGLKLSEGTERAHLYLEVAWEYRKSHPDSTVLYCEKALNLAKVLSEESKIESKALNFMGVAYHYMGDNVRSFEFYKQAIESSLQYGDSIQYAHSLNSLGRTYLNQGDFLKAYDNYFEALEIFKKLNDKKGIGYCYKSLSELYITQGKYEKAIEMAQKTLEIRIATGNVRGQISILTEMAIIQRNIENYDKAFDYYLQAKIKAESINDQISIANINLGISKLYYKQEMLTESLIYSDKAYETTKETLNYNLYSNILLQMGKVYFQNGDINQALTFLKETLTVAKKSQELDLLRDANYFISEIYKQKGQFQLAYEYFTVYSEYNDKLNSAEVARTIERYESRIEIEQKDQQNDLLLANQARDQAIIERQRIQNWALLVICLVILILGTIIFIISRKRRLTNIKLTEKNNRIATQREEIAAQNDQISNQNKELKINNEKLKELNNEKNTLMNIVAHDLKSPFNRIKGLVELLKLSETNAEQKNYISLLSDISSSGIELIRDLLDVNALEEEERKIEINQIDVHDLLLEKSKLFYSDAKAKGINISFNTAANHISLISDEVYLSRILDNLISNAIKFSPDNSEISLDAGRALGHIYISISDNGPGFSEEDKKHLYKKFKKLSARPTAGESSNGLGLAIVKTLVDRLGGEIELDSKINHGSTFTIKFPIKQTIEEITSS